MSYRIRSAGERETGTDCCDCREEIPFGAMVAVCNRCGGVHHETCWMASGGCCAYECRGGRSDVSAAGPVMRVSLDELQRAEPLPSRPSTSPGFDRQEFERERKWNKAAVWAFILSLLGIPLFGLVTGLVAMVLGCIALVGHSRRYKGFGLAVAAVLIGLVDVVGWSAGLAVYMGHGNLGANVAIDDFIPDEESLKDLPDHIARAMRANVLIHSSQGILSQGIGSGVILKVENGSALIVTNRHVIDHSFNGAESDAPDDLSSLSTVEVQSVGDGIGVGTIEWIAPHGIDLALLTVPLGTNEIRQAIWNLNDLPKIGESVFAIGNPHGLGWTHSAGDVSQIRRQSRGVVTYRVLQTTAAINPGNSGGGLYDAQGNLLGINTLTGDKRFAEGLGFSISFEALVELAPEKFGLGQEQIDDEQDGQQER